MANADDEMTMELTPDSLHLLKEWPNMVRRHFEQIEQEWLAKAGDWMVGIMGRAFQMQAQPGGDPWPENSEAWTDYKLAHGYGSAVNIMTSEMQMSISKELRQKEVAAGSPLEYSKKAHVNNRSFFPQKEYGEAYLLKMLDALVKYRMETA